MALPVVAWSSQAPLWATVSVLVKWKANPSGDVAFCVICLMGYCEGKMRFCVQKHFSSYKMVLGLWGKVYFLKVDCMMLVNYIFLIYCELSHGWHSCHIKIMFYLVLTPHAVVFLLEKNKSSFIKLAIPLVLISFSSR